LRQSNPRVVKDPLAVVLIWRNNVDRIHLGLGLWPCRRENR
jgi:hypothetical protein